MTLRRMALLALVLVLGMALMPAAAAAGHEGIYISMGDSVPAGTRPNMPVTNTAYPDVLFAHAADDMGLTEHMDISCPGEDSSELISGDGSYCYNTAFSQLDYALSIIAADPGAVKLITITIGANDVLACTAEPDVFGCVGGALPVLGENLGIILGTLRGAGYAGPIVGMNYYNPLMAYQLSDVPALQGLAGASELLVDLLNTQTLENVYGLFDVPVADVETKFKTLDTSGAVYPRNLRYVCKFTYMCERTGTGLGMSDWSDDPGDQPDIHPTPRGHRKIAAAFLRIMEKAGIL